MMEFRELPFILNLALFAAGAAIVWFAGSRISLYADIISRKTGLGEAILGLLLLAGVTSLPEIGVTLTAAAQNNTTLAVNNLFGSIAMQIVMLAVVDYIASRRALTSALPEPVVLLLCALNLLLLGVAVAGIIAGDISIGGIGAWAWACLLTYIGCLWLLSKTRGRMPWQPMDQRGDRRKPKRKSNRSKRENEYDALTPVIWRTVAAASAILVAGYVLAQSGEALAKQTGLGSSFVGYVLLAVSTSLPELSTALSAARRGLFVMAISDILGTNMINVGMVFLVDAVASGEPALAQANSFSTFGIVIAMVLTTLFLIGMIERRDKTIGRMGIDSVAVLIVYVVGLGILFTMRG